MTTNVETKEKGWTSSMDGLVRKWADYCRIRSIMHERTGALYEKGHYIVGPLTVISSSIAAITQFANIGNQSCSDGQNEWNSFAIAVVVFVLLSSVFSGLQTFFRFDKTSTQHRTASAKYGALQRDLEEQLSLQIRDRDLSQELIRTTKKELNTLSSLNLTIPAFVANKYVRDVDAVLATVAPPSQQPSAPNTDVIIPVSTATPPTELLKQKDTLNLESQKGLKTEKDVVEEEDYQDEFAEAIREQLHDRQTKIEAYQLNRLS